MREQIELRLAELARRAGLAGVPPAVVFAALLVCVIAVGGAAWRWWPRESALPVPDVAAGGVSAVSGSEPGTAGTGGKDGTGGGSGPGVGGSASAAASSTSAVYVHVVGAVRRPGMYQLAAGARVAAAIDAAGGLVANAAQAGINLARVVTDGEQITVPTADKLARGAVGGPVSPGAVGVSVPGSSDSAGAAAQVNINTADAAALDTLPGVGPSTAAKIVADREANGPFASAEDLGRVAGIGPKKLEELKPRVCVR